MYHVTNPDLCRQLVADRRTELERTMRVARLDRAARAARRERRRHARQRHE